VQAVAWTIADLAGATTPGIDELGRALFLKKGLLA
jgi:magnesium chelatase family protein